MPTIILLAIAAALAFFGYTLWPTVEFASTPIGQLTIADILKIIGSGILFLSAFFSTMLALFD
jgi:hypothetical protein